MIPRAIPIIMLTGCALAAAGCRHHQKIAPIITPPTAAVKAPAPEVHLAPSTDFVTTKPADDLADVAHATEIADAKGWLRDAYFDFDSSLLRSDARENLNESASWLKSHRKFNVLIEGHCDERGTERYNLALGERRAWEAKDYLAILGLDPDHVKTISYGKEKLFDSAHDEAAWAKNRRAHLVLTATQ